MNRKDFIRSSSILAVASLFSSEYSFAASPSIVFKKALGYDMIKEDLSVMDKFKLVKDLGFDGIEINTPSKVSIPELFEASEVTGIQIPSTVNADHWAKPLSSSDPNIRKEIIRSVGDSIEQTKILGGDTVLVVPGVVNENMSYEVAYKNSLESVRQLIPLAENSGVKIGLENVWNNFILSPVEAKHFLDEINHPLVGWYFDIGNILRYGWPEHWIETLNNKIFKLHVKEFSKKKMEQEGLRKGFNVELLEGDINWQKVMKTLREVNYNGEWITLEVGGGDRAHLQKLSSQLDIIVKS